MFLLACLSLLLSVGQAQELVGANYRDFSGGLVDSVDPSNLQPNQSPNLLNVTIDDPAGSLKPRQGFLSCGITPSGQEPTVLFEYNRGDGAPRLLVSDNTNVWQTFDCVSFTTVTTGGSASLIPSMAQVRDKVWIVNGSTHVMTWNGTTTSLLDGRSGTPSPAPPKGRYIKFWKERVWIARTSDKPSAVFFSDLTDSIGNDLDPSTGTLSWPADNEIQIAQENGSPLYGIEIYRDNLFAFKDNGIWRVDFPNAFDLSVIKTLAFAGTRYQKSVVEHDNLLHFAGKDGIYAFDGDSAVKESDLFQNKWLEVNQTAVQSSFRIWDTQTDWEQGTCSSCTTTLNPGSITISTRTGQIATFDNGALADMSSNTWTCVPGAGYTTTDACGPFDGGESFLGPYSARCTGPTTSDSGTMFIFNVSGTTVAESGTTVGSVTLDALASGGSISTYTATVPSLAGTVVRLHFTGSGSHLYSSTFTLGGVLTFQYKNTASNGLLILDNFQSTLYHATGTWTSEIYNLVSVSSFSTFEAQSVSNGGNVAYKIRVGTSATAITQNAYVSITPGSLISGTTSDIYVQVTSSLTTPTSLDATPELQSITVNVIQGTGSNQSIYSYSREGRLYVSASTGSAATTNNIVFVKSRAPLTSWSIFDWRIGPMVTFNDRFYAGHSTHSAISRMNYGTSDNSAAIDWYWQSRDETYSLPNNKKYLMEIGADFRKGTETALKLGYSRDQGSTFTNRTVNVSGTGRGTTRQYVAGSNSLDYRFRIGGNTRDGTVTLLGFTGWARPAKLRE